MEKGLFFILKKEKTNKQHEMKFDQKKKNPLKNVPTFDLVVSLLESVLRKLSEGQTKLNGTKVLTAVALILIKLPTTSTATKGIIYGTVR